MARQMKSAPVRFGNSLTSAFRLAAMRIRRVHVKNFRRFTDLTIDFGDQVPRLVMLCGPNGSGKSSLFDALNLRVQFVYGGWNSGDTDYYLKQGVPPESGAVQVTPEQVSVDFHETNAHQVARNAVYVRSAYRNDPEFSISEIRSSSSPFDGPKASRMIENDARVADNYQRLVGQTIASLYSGEDDGRTGREIRDRLIGQLREVLQTVLPDLELIGSGDPLDGGTFLFKKGVSTRYAYKNLSGGEKAAFDILLDLVAKRSSYDDTVFCIDEPEVHLNPKLHGDFLDSMLSLIGPTSQLWLATHSAGMMKRARDLQSQNPGSVAFIDFDVDFDQTQNLAPVTVDRAFWRRTLSVAFGDMAELVAPAHVVLCEGEPTGGVRSDFDARCLRTIFGERHPDTEFIGIGNDLQVQSDQHGIGRAVEALAPGTIVERLVDRDDRTPSECADLAAAGTRVLGRRNLESYLLDEEVLQALCDSVGQAGRWTELQVARQQTHAESTAPPRNNPADDWKPCAGVIYTSAKRILGLTGVGNNKDTFMRDTLAPLFRPEMAVYRELEFDVFGPSLGGGTTDQSA